MPNDRGGIAAIGGFLFQVMVAAGLKTATEVTEQAGDGSKLKALIKLAGETDLFAEAFDQDIALKETAERGRNGLTLIQVKYSLNQSSIGPAEMRDDIYPAFERAFTAADNDGETCTALSLITNRTVSDNLQQHLNATQKKFLTDLQFKVYKEYGFDLWRGYLVDFCGSYGWTPSEVNAKVDALLGHILSEIQRTEGPFQLTQDQLLIYLAGSQSARALSRKNAIELASEELAFFGDRVQGEVVRRDILAKAEEELENRAIIVFEGLGGARKTASLLDWADGIAKQENAGAPIISLRGAEQAKDPWLPDFATKLNPALDVQNDSQSIHRFEIANPLNRSVLFHLGLDGIDDQYPSASTRSAAVTLLHRFLQLDEESRRNRTIPRSRLVVTCRSFETVCKDLLRIHRTALSKNGYRDRALCLSFEFFSESELRELLRLNRPNLLPYVFPAKVVFGEDAVYGKFSYSTNSESGSLARAEKTDFRTLETTAAITSPKKNYADLLYDPVMWASFMELTREQQEAWLKGDDSFESRMAELYVNRFVEKAHLRVGSPENILHLCLRQIARLNTDDGNFRTRQEWNDWATRDRLLDVFVAGQLCEEAISGGLVTSNAQLQWQWRRPLIASYLRTEVVP